MSAPPPSTPKGPVRWVDLTGPEIEEIGRLDPVAVLPLAAVEQHGPHLPVSTDLDLACGILERACQRVASHVSVVTLPALALGSSLEHRDEAGTLDLDESSLALNLRAVGKALARHGWRRLVLFNTHGGNKGVVENEALELRARHDLLVVKAHSFRFPLPADPGVDLPAEEWLHGLHGGAVETAMMLYLRPDAVRTERVRSFRSLGEDLAGELAYLAPEGPVSFAWLARDLNPYGVTGDARLASSELGRLLVEHFAHVLARVIEDAARFPIDRLSRPGSERDPR